MPRPAALFAALLAAGGGTAVRAQSPIPLKVPDGTVPAARSQAPQPPASATAPVLDAGETAALAAQLRELLLKNLPDPVVQTAPGWGRQKDTTVGVKFHRDGWKLWSEPQKAPRNDGTWRRMSVSARNPAASLAVALKDVVSPEPGRVTFTAMVGLDCGLRFEQQNWKGGVRLYSGETRARCRAALLLHCESTTRVERQPGAILPDAVLRTRVTDAQLFYDDLVVEHLPGFGGDAAKVLGEALVSAVRQAKPQLERDLLAKANAAVVKAGDTKEVRVSLGRLLEGTAPAVVKAK